MKPSIQHPLRWISAAVLFLMLTVPAWAQTLTQTIKGTVLDGQSRAPIAGATVLLLDSGAVKGAITDDEGRFHLTGVPIGRKAVQVKMLGYENVVRTNLMLLSGKELDIEILMEETVTQLETVEITDEDHKHDPLNQMATVSSRSFSVEEAGRYSGSFQDPARMAQNFAGVSGASDDRNDIIIRGNSPTGVLWRMEGIDIPSPNHFSTLGTTGGPVSMLNINNLANSDFMTSAFTADYGNATSGVFDLKLRNGNSDRHEYLAQVGFNGFEAGLEGPFKKGHSASYLANYRYSMLAVVNALGISVGTGAAVPYYQDLTFKINVPTKKAGTFSLFGIGGMSTIEFLAEEAGDNNLYSSATQNSKFNSKTGVTGLSHTYFFSEKTYGKLVLAMSATQNDGRIDSIAEGSTVPVHTFEALNRQIKYSGHYRINHKFNARNSFNAGVLADLYHVVVDDSSLGTAGFAPLRNFTGNAMLMQAYAQWQHRFGTRLSMTLGAHSQHFLFNNTHSAEPRLGLRYKLNEKQNLNFGAGLHSQLQPLPVYFVESMENGTRTLPNQNLDFSRSMHLVLGTDRIIATDLRLKTEVYYQYLFNVPVHSYASSFSMLNAGRNFVLPSETDLVNQGTGYNYGLEVTLEKFFSKGYYFLFTTSLFNSRYEGSDDVERNTAFNGNYVFNLLGGKEFKLGKRNTFSLDSKITYAGGSRFTPIDLAASQAAHQEVRDESQAFTEQYPNYFRADLKMTFRMNRKNFAQQFSIDFQNITNHQNVFQYGYNASSGKVSTVFQRGFFPDVQYKVFF